MAILVILYTLLLKMAIEIVDLPINNGDFPVRYASLPEANPEKKRSVWSS